MIKYEEHEFTGSQPDTLATTHTAGTGYVFNDYFWLKILWTDADGIEHELESDQARCLQGS